MTYQERTAKNVIDKSLCTVLLILFFLSLTALARGETPVSPARFSFEKVEKLPLGSSQELAKNLFGSPSQVYRLKSNGDIVWVYIEGSEFLHRSQRLSLTFSGSELKVSSIHYQPLPPDEVSIVKGLLAHFPKARFKKVEPSTCGEHYQINKGFEYDQTLGLYFTRDKAGRVTGLNITPPLSDERKTAAEPPGCPDKSTPQAMAEEITPALK